MRREVTVLRPYSDRIRAKVFAILEQAGLQIPPENVIPPHLSDAEVVEQMRGRRVEVFLIPFHAMRDASGRRTNGIELLERLERELPESRNIPVLMPVSMFGSAAVGMMLNQDRAQPRVAPSTARRILVLEEDQLGGRDLPELVRRHVAAF